VRLDVPVGHPDFGRAVMCKCKEREIEERERLQLRKISSLLPFERCTFDTFDPSIPDMEEAYKVALRYAQDPTGWLIFQGDYGCGKTHLAAAIAHVREDAGDTVFFSIVPELLDHLRAAFAPTSELTYDALFERVRESGLLVLDDLGAENATAWATEKLFQLINHRYNFRMPTVITTNASLMSHMDKRIGSRLSDLGLVRRVNIKAQDYRIRHAGRPSRGNGGSRGRGSYTR
jgi:DNA replication protein DnaC